MRIGSTDALSAVKTERVSPHAKAPEKHFPEKDKIHQTEETDMVKLSEKTVIKAIERANDAIRITNRRFEFKIHEKTKKIMVKVIAAETDEIIREIPPEKILDMVAMMWEMVGIIVDERR